jgi:hypothetical protein
LNRIAFAVSGRARMAVTTANQKAIASAAFLILRFPEGFDLEAPAALFYYDPCSVTGLFF